MVQSRNVEIMVGVFMAAGLVALFFLAMQVSNLSTSSNGEGYELTARFDNIGSLKEKAPVTMAGVRIGRVAGVVFDQQTYEAVVRLKIESQYNTIPDDTFAKIFTAGLLGEQYIGLDPGGSEVFLKEGGQISLTQSALVLEEIIGQFLFSKAEEGDALE
jgi:phospholipid/cholesterol/gamma-HCH transport system substrate-binding protein